MRIHAKATALLGLLLCIGSGTALAAWPPAGVHLERPAPADSSGISGAGSDGQGGMFIAWPETNIGAIAFRVHHLSSTGDPVPGWTTSGLRTGSPPYFNQPFVIPDGAGGAYLYWSNYVDFQARVLRIGSDGAVSPGWPATGVLVSSAGQQDLVATDDGA